MSFSRRHRLCGCDCRDSDQYEPDPLTFNPTCYTLPDGSKPPCKYIARFECPVSCNGVSITGTGTSFTDVFQSTSDLGSSIPDSPVDPDIWLRPFCEFRNAQLYVATTSQVPFGDLGVGCSWLDRISSSENGVANQDAITQFKTLVVWTLDTAATPVTLTHVLGWTYQQKKTETWNPFGPNTLWLTDQTANDKCTTVSGGHNSDKMPNFVCITPAVTRYVPEDNSCDNCFSITLPKITPTSTTILTSIPAQTANFRPVPKAFFGNLIKGKCAYVANLLEGVSFYESYVNAVWIDVAGGLDNGQTSSARLFFIPWTATYECKYFQCGVDNVFTLATNNPGAPQTLTVKSHPCYINEINDKGMCVPCDGQSSTRLYQTDITPYNNEKNRCACCDPYCKCMNGTIRLVCSGHVYDHKGCFCQGGRTGVASPVGPSREFCSTFDIGDGTGSHTICVVAYCVDGGAWKTDWYCDGAFQSTATCGSTCCPLAAWTTSQVNLNCINCKGCISIQSDPQCVAPEPCCPIAKIPATLTAAFVSTGMGTFSVTLTKGGSTWTGTGTTGNGDPCSVLFTPGSGVNGCDCELGISCYGTGGIIFCLNVVSCSPPSYTGSATGSAGPCGGNFFSSHTVTLS